jgi:hypothetical protein
MIVVKVSNNQSGKELFISNYLTPHDYKAKLGIMDLFD